MSSIVEKIEQEKNKESNVILLRREGVFLRAYEQSAWMLCVAVHHFKVSKHFIKKIGQDVVYVGFPIESLAKWAADRETEEMDGIVKVYLNDEDMAKVSATVFEEWKADIELNDKTKTNVVHSCSTDEVLNRLKNFPLESKTPMDCMLFVAELKKLLVE